MIRNPSRDRLPFDTIAVVAMNKNGDINQKKMKELIRIFRPNREGELSMLDFVRSCDSKCIDNVVTLCKRVSDLTFLDVDCVVAVYKSLRLLRASISNSGQIDQAFEVLINYAFYIVLVCIILAANGFNPLALFLSFSSIILAFAFVIGSASSKYFEVRSNINVESLAGTFQSNHISNFIREYFSSWFAVRMTLVIVLPLRM